MSENVGLHLSKRAILDPDLEALVDIGADVRYTLAELDERADRSANALAQPPAHGSRRQWRNYLQQSVRALDAHLGEQPKEGIPANSP
jgi:acyl-CoA synthetase (AMP-forming)/AMP-acid ligase II